MEYNYNTWAGIPPNPTLYPNPTVTDPYQYVPQNPNLSSYALSYGLGHESQGQGLVYGYGHTNGGATTSSVEATTTVYYQDPNVLRLLLGANESYRVGEVAAVYLNGAEKLTPANVNSNFFIQPSRSGSWGGGQRKIKIQPVWCDVCKLEFNSKTVLDQHKLGKRHKRSLDKLKGGSVITTPTSAPLVASAASDIPFVGLQKKPNKVAAVSLNGAENLTPANVNSNFFIQPPRSGSWGGGQRKIKIQPLWCDVCKLEFNSKTVLDQHKLGKRHQRSLDKLKGGSVITTPTSAPLVASAVSDNPFVGLQKKPNKVNSANGQDSVENLETKRQKLLEGGAATDEVRICLACNVVCNSETVFKTHLIGKKHIANITKQHNSAPAAASLVPSEVSVNTYIGPQEKPDIVNSGNGQDAMKKAAELIENLETKTQKVLEGGAATSEVRKCLVCKVVCNSETVFRLHLAGKKHIANMKKQASGVAPAN